MAWDCTYFVHFNVWADTAVCNMGSFTLWLLYPDNDKQCDFYDILKTEWQVEMFLYLLNVALK